MTEFIIFDVTVILTIVVLLLWFWWKKTMYFRNLYIKHHKDNLTIDHCVLKKIEIYSVAKHLNCYYNFQKVLLFTGPVIFSEDNISANVINNVFNISKQKHYLSFDIKHIVCLKEKWITAKKHYFVSRKRNHVSKNIVFLYRNYIYRIEFFNKDYYKILNNFHNSKFALKHLKRIRNKCYLRSDYRQAISLIARNNNRNKKK